jgi:hypothetical protein
LLRSAIERVASAWTTFWFAPRSGELLGVIRLLLGVLLVYAHVASFPFLEAFYGPHGMVPPETLRESGVYPFNWTFLAYVGSSSGLVAVHSAVLVVYALFALGLFTIVTGPAAFVCCLSYAYRNELIIFGYDQIMALLLFCTVLGRNADHWSLPSYLRRKRGLPAPPPAVSTNFALRLIQIELSIVYLCAGYAKALSGWFDGVSLWNALRAFEPSYLDLRWLASERWLMRMAATVVVLWELQFCWLIWLKPTRRLMLVLAIAVHAGIAFAMQLGIFSAVMLTGCIAFLRPEDFADLKALRFGLKRLASTLRN